MCKFGEKSQHFSLILIIEKIKPSDMVHVGDDVHQDFNIPRTLGISSYLLDRTRERNGEHIIKDLGKLEVLLTYR